MDEVVLDGKKFISARKAAEITSYEQDYIGQLARMGKVLARQIGRAWFIEEQSLLAHRSDGRTKKKHKKADSKEIETLKDTSIFLKTTETSVPEATKKLIVQDISSARDEAVDKTPADIQSQQNAETTFRENVESPTNPDLVTVPVKHGEKGTNQDTVTAITLRHGERKPTDSRFMFSSQDYELLTYVVDDGPKTPLAVSTTDQVIHDKKLSHAPHSIPLRQKNPLTHRHFVVPMFMSGATLLTLVFVLSVMVFDERTFSRSGSAFTGDEKYVFHRNISVNAALASVVAVWKRLF